MKFRVWIPLLLCCAFTPPLQAQPSAGEYSPKDQLRMLGATHTLPSNDIEAFMKPIREHGYNAVMVHGLDDDWGATYPSKFFPMAPWRNFKEDTLKNIIETCHREGVQVLVYVPYMMRTANPAYIDLSPEEAAGWEPYSGTGPQPSHARLASFDSLFRDLLAGALKEICALGADGIWVDGFTMEYANLPGQPYAHGAAAYKQDTGLEWPATEDWESDTFRRWVKWRYQRHLDNGKWLADQVRAQYPKVTLSFNTHFMTPSVQEADVDGPPLSWNRWREAVPLARFPGVVGASNHARLHPSNLAQSTPFWLSISSDTNPLRCDLWQPVFPERLNLNLLALGLPSDALGLRLSALAAFTFSSQIWLEGEIHKGRAVQPATYTRINDALRAREAWFGGERVKRVGVLLSNNTRDYWGLRQAAQGGARNADRLYVESYMGLSSLLMGNQIQYAHIFDNTLNDETLAQFPVVILPNAACLSDEALGVLRRYVEQGGHLIATYETSLYDEWGNRRNDFGLSDLFGVSYFESRHRTDMDPPHWGRDLADAAFNGGMARFAWQSRRTVIEAAPDTQILARDADITVPALKPEETLAGSPAIVRRVVGKGEVTYIVDDLTQSYYQSPYRSIWTILHALIERASSPYTVDAPAQIITNGFWQQEGNRLVIHLLNLPIMSTRLFDRSQVDSLDEIAPAHDLSVTFHLKGRVKSARLVPAGVDMPIETIQGGGQKVLVPRVEEHEMLVVELSPAGA